MLESYEKGKCYFCGSEIIGNPISCQAYDYVLICEGESCKYCVQENKEPNPDAYWCDECRKGYDFKKHEPLPLKHKGTQSTLGG